MKYLRDQIENGMINEKLYAHKVILNSEANLTCAE